MSYKENQIFTGEYPAEAAQWCNENSCYIEEIAASKTGERRFKIVAIPAPTEAELAERRLADLKAERAVAVDAITVEVDGLVFDANESAQSRMARAVVGAVGLGLDLDTTSMSWVLADNSIASVTGRQLARALQLAGAEQSALWVLPYTTADKE